MTKSRSRPRIQGGGVGAAGPHLEGVQRPDLSVPDESGTGPLGKAPRGGRKIAVVSPITELPEYPTPEVSDRPARRQFTAAYKLRILQETDVNRDTGEIGRILRREGLYSSHLGKWRHERERGALVALEPKKRGRRAVPKNPLAGKVAELERVIRRQEAQLKRQLLLLEIQKKMAELLGSSPTSSDSEEERS